MSILIHTVELISTLHTLTAEKNELLAKAVVLGVCDRNERLKSVFCV